MRLLLALGLVVFASESYAACSQAQLAGTWVYSRPFLTCTLTINDLGRGNGPCSRGGTFKVRLTLSSTCKVSGSLNAVLADDAWNDDLKGRADPNVTLIVGQSVRSEAPFTAFRK